VSPDQGRSRRKPGLPRWVYRALWALHRAGYAISGGRLGLRPAADDRLGILRLGTLGRRSGKARASLLSYLPAGEGFAVVASNAGAPYPPAWALNLQARPEAIVELPGRSLRVRARVAGPEERASLWARFVERVADYERYAEQAEREIPVLILEPIAEEADA